MRRSGCRGCLNCLSVNGLRGNFPFFIFFGGKKDKIRRQRAEGETRERTERRVERARWGVQDTAELIYGPMSVLPDAARAAQSFYNPGGARWDGQPRAREGEMARYRLAVDRARGVESTPIDMLAARDDHTLSLYFSYY